MIILVNTILIPQNWGTNDDGIERYINEYLGTYLLLGQTQLVELNFYHTLRLKKCTFLTLLYFQYTIHDHILI